MPIVSTKPSPAVSSHKPVEAGSLFFRGVNGVLIFVAAVFLMLHLVHLRADFPNHSPWMDWSKYTDEGWYSDAAIRHIQLGHWYVAGDFNPGAALPVWPAMEGVVFHFTGVSLIAARGMTVGIFACTLLAAYLLLKRWHHLTDREHATSFAPGIGVLLLAVSPFCYVFTRMAILEPLLILLTLLSFLAVSYIDREQMRSSSRWFARYAARNALCVLSLGLLLPLMVLTKTTAIFIFPAIAWLLFASSGYRVRSFCRIAVPSSLTGLCLWSAYFGLVVRPHYLADYRYLFSANAYTGISLANAIAVLSNTVSDGLWIGPLVYPLAVLCTLGALLAFERLRSNPLLPSLLLWSAGYTCFLAYHNNLQPRYYLVVAVPLTLLIAIVFDGLWFSPLWSSTRVSTLQRFSAAGAALVLLFVVFRDARQTLQYVRTPEYTFLHAAESIHNIIATNTSRSPLVLSISGSDISLMTGLPSICDDFGTMELVDRVKTYRPGWYVSWNQVDDDKMDALAQVYHLERIAAFPAMDDPERNLMILYRLDPANSMPLPGRRRRVIPRRLQTKVGQQPSVTQLEH